MGEVIGFLRENRATFGEMEVLKRLENGLPPDFSIYVECPIPTEETQRFPDFIVVTNFGVIVLEVKDWVQVLEFDKYNVKVFQGGGKHRVEKNPVLSTRAIAIALNKQLQKVPELVDERRHKCNVPWGYGVVFTHLPTAVISQMRQVWGEPNVLNLDDLEPFRLTQRLKAMVPRDSTLRREELRYVRAVINPVIVVSEAGARSEPASRKPAVILDHDQERLVTEPVKPQKPEPRKDEGIARQEDLFEQLAAPKTEEETIDEILSVEQKISQNLSVRLVRGFAGSGKSLVLQQRARYLAAQNPDWKILVLTYNEKPARRLEKILKGTKIKSAHFHKICSQILADEVKNASFTDSEGWIERWKHEFSIVQQLGSRFIGKEITWMIEMGLETRSAYCKTERKGRGKEVRLHQFEREQVFDVYEAYRAYLKEQKQFDWADVPYLVLEAIEDGKVQPPSFHAILIDEAQDFAPSWISVVRRLLVPEQGLLFLADDPMQSIYRYYSWREKGVPVVGRSRWLRVPYRNTRKIYQAAYEVIRTDEALKQAIENETGLMIEPDLSTLRHGAPPRLRRFDRLENEVQFIQSEIERLRLMGYASEDIVVLTRRKNGIKRLRNLLRGTGVEIETFHSLKGLENEIVIISQMQDTFAGLENEEEISQERRLIYMAMTRARSNLYLCYEGVWPSPLKGVLEYVK